MFLINVHYKKPLEVVDQFVVEHREFLEQGYQKDYFVVSGPKNPRTGGIIISQLTDREKIESLMKQDPFYIHGVADYDITEFTPVKYHPGFSEFIEN